MRAHFTTLTAPGETVDKWRVDCIQRSIAPEGQIERENTDMAKKTLKKSKKLQSAKTLRAGGI
jgi:hypothetical protein